MQWNESYTTGVPRLDQHHRRLFKVVTAMSKVVASDDGASEFLRLLGFLDHYCRNHFGDEEGCMLRYRCPAAHRNKQQHEGLLQLLAKHRRYYTANGYDPDDALVLTNSMKHWLHSHICGVDRQLCHCVKPPIS